MCIPDNYKELDAKAHREWMRKDEIKSFWFGVALFLSIPSAIGFLIFMALISNPTT